MNNLHLTQSQLSIWLGQKLNPNAPLYNVTHAFNIHGFIDVDDFKKAFNLLVENCDALRMVFYENDSEPFQKINSNLAYELEFLDFSNLNESELRDYILKRSERQLNLQECVFDSKIIKVKPNQYIWFLNIHHIVTDAVTSTILFSLMSDFYKAINENTPKDFKNIPQFKSYIDYELNQQSVEKNKEVTNYWKEKIASLKKPELYGRKNLVTNTKAFRVVVPLGKERSEKLKEIAKLTEVCSWTQDLTLFNMFASILLVYLHRVSGQNKLAIGTPSHNRPTKTFKKTPGLFIEFFPLVAEIEEHETFLTLLQRIKIEANNYLRYAQSGMSTSQISKSYNVVLNFINASFPDFNGLKMQSEWIYPNHIDANHDLRCHVYDMDATGELSIFLDLNEVVFDEHNNVSNHFLNVIDAFINDINQPIQKQSLLTSQEEQTFFKSKIKTSSRFRSVINAFEENATNNPNAMALQYKNQTLTYGGLNKKANQLAHYLIEQGVKAGDKIALYNYRDSSYVINVLAVMKSGGTFIPIASNQPAARIKYIAEDSGCKFILTNSELKSNLENIPAQVVDLQWVKNDIDNHSLDNLDISQKEKNLAYVLYTSGSTGNPKGVLISNKAFSNYIFWGKSYYDFNNKSSFALFTSIGFDLTITSTFVPLVSGGRIVVYKEDKSGIDAAVMDVISDNLVDTIKLTPSHLTLFKDKDLSHSAIKKIIVGGEDFKVNLAKAITNTFGNHVQIFNEYGPTEATVGCIVCLYNKDLHKSSSVPIGHPIENMHAYILDPYKNLVPQGVVGELYLSGESLANGYLGLEALTVSKFVDNPFVAGLKMYNTGDLARINAHGEYEYLGRTDEQVKFRGYRIELADIESNLINIEGVENCAVVLSKNNKTNISEEAVINCTACGLPSNYPETDFDDYGICHLCNAFEGYKEKAQKYFKTEEELKSILTINKGNNQTYDCLSLLSGGKDSTYILAQLVGMGLKVLAFTLDNGYISQQAKDNVNRTVKKLGVDHIYGQTQHMNAIFIDSLNRHQNVCNGCFKTIYTLSTKIAMEKEIPFIVTGLSRGQFFETRLTEELFWDDNLDATKIDDTILEVRKLYHREEDAVKALLDVSLFENDAVFDKVQFVDFYRYSDVSLEVMLRYLEDTVGWVRPTDTGRSTNCLINQVGIYVHKKEKGYSNYSFPYSWDVRLGHKTRDESLEEINEYIDEVEVKRIMEEIGYEDSDDLLENDEKLVAYYTGKDSILVKDLKAHLLKKVPAYMMPSAFKHLDEMPLTKNGKIDKKALKDINYTNKTNSTVTAYVSPRNDIEDLVCNVWRDVLRLDRIGIHDNFIALGGHSLAAIRVTSRINDKLGMEIPLNKVFNLPTIEGYSNYLEKIMLELLDEQDY